MKSDTPQEAGSMWLRVSPEAGSMWLRISELTQEIERLRANSKLMEASIATLKGEQARLEAEFELRSDLEIDRLRKQCGAWAQAVLDNCDRETAKEIFDAQKRASTDPNSLAPPRAI